jgi:hypothetical protein
VRFLMPPRSWNSPVHVVFEPRGESL